MYIQFSIKKTMNDVSFIKKSVTNPVLHCRIFVNIESKRFSIEYSIKSK